MDSPSLIGRRCVWYFWEEAHLHFSVTSMSLKNHYGESYDRSFLSWRSVSQFYLLFRLLIWMILSVQPRSVSNLWTLLTVICSLSVVDSCQLTQLAFIIHQSSSPAQRGDREPKPTGHDRYLRKPLTAISAGNLPGCERLDISGFTVMATALLCSNVWSHLNKDGKCL